VRTLLALALPEITTPPFEAATAPLERVALVKVKVGETAVNPWNCPNEIDDPAVAGRLGCIPMNSARFGGFDSPGKAFRMEPMSTGPVEGIVGVGIFYKGRI
jgi:hypothetical protein